MYLCERERERKEWGGAGQVLAVQDLLYLRRLHDQAAKMFDSSENCCWRIDSEFPRFTRTFRAKIITGGAQLRGQPHRDVVGLPGKAWTKHQPAQ